AVPLDLEAAVELNDSMLLVHRRRQILRDEVKLQLAHHRLDRHRLALEGDLAAHDVPGRAAGETAGQEHGRQSEGDPSNESRAVILLWGVGRYARVQGGYPLPAPFAPFRTFC